MMSARRTWTRALRPMRCGSCGAELARGVPIQQIRFERIKVTRTRGECCAEGKPPADLPALIEHQAIQSSKLTPRLATSLPLDWKARATGEREPGEEG